MHAIRRRENDQFVNGPRVNSTVFYERTQLIKQVLTPKKTRLRAHVLCFLKLRS